jgi:hypothetical protein
MEKCFYIMRDRLYTFTIRAFAVLLLLPLSGCIPVPVYRTVPAEIEDINIPEHQFKGIVIAPYFHRAEVNEFTEALSATDKTIEVVDTATAFMNAFPDREPNIEIAISELLQPEVRDRITATGIRFAVVLSPYQTTTTEGDGTFIAVYAHGSSEVSTKLMAGLIDLEKPGSPEYLETRASGKDSATWILPYLGLFIFGNVPKTEESAMAGTARQILTQIRRKIPAQHLKIMVVAGSWESARLSHEKEQALEKLRDNAVQGEQEAQWELYHALPTDENLVWLCRAADQGHARARNELGKLYFYGSNKYRDFKETHIPADLSRSCMWFHLAGQAQITDTPDAEMARLLPAEFETAEVERTARAMNERELAAAEILILDWEPGQCDRDFSESLSKEYAKDPALAKLCTAADLGDFTSRDELGRIYFFGSRGVPEDLPRAYMWYRLAAKVYVPASLGGGSMQPVCDAMTPEQQLVAERLLANWKTGQCENKLMAPGTQ